MNKTGSLLALVVLAVALCGCPYDSPYSIDETPSIALDESLLGKWAVMVKKPGYDGYQKEEPVKIIFEQASEQEYKVMITGYINELKRYQVIQNDTIQGRAFLSTVADHRFLNVQIQNKFLVVEVKQQGKILSLLPLRENFTSKFIRSNSDLRNAIFFHYQTVTQPFYDDWFCMSNMQRVN
jgi:hypothetical protein